MRVIAANRPCHVLIVPNQISRQPLRGLAERVFEA
jgi:hypothetical protein